MRLAPLARHRWSALAALVVLEVYAVTLFSIPLGVFWSPDEGGKYFELRSIQWQGGLRTVFPYAGRRIDAALAFRPRSPGDPSATFPYGAVAENGEIRFHWPLWFPLLSWVGFQLFGVAGIHVVPLLSGWLTAVTAGWIAYRLDSRLAPAAILFVGLGTPVWFYSVCFWEHTLATFLSTLAMAVIIGFAGSVAALAAALVLLCAATLLRIEVAALAVACACAGAAGVILRRSLPKPPARESTAPSPRGNRLSFALIVGLSAIVLAGAPHLLVSRHRDFIAALPAKIAAAGHKLPGLPRAAVAMLVSSDRSEGPSLDGRWALAAFAGVALCSVAPFLSSAPIEAAALLPGLALVAAFSASLVVLNRPYRSLHGVFPVAPFLVLWLYAIRAATRRGLIWRVAAALALVSFAAGLAAIFLYYTDSQGHLRTGIEWGQRYLLGLYPLLAVLSLAAMVDYAESARPAWLRRCAVGLAAVAVLLAVTLELRGVTMLRSNRAVGATWNGVLWSHGPVVTDVWWLPAILAGSFVTNEAYLVANEAEAEAWLALARQHGVERFTFASLARGGGTTGRPFAAPAASRTISGLEIDRFVLGSAGGAAPLQ
jgi:hypothetical protein